VLVACFQLLAVATFQAFWTFLREPVPGILNEANVELKKRLFATAKGIAARLEVPQQCE